MTHREVLSFDGPLLIACNHPNSFLDAIIIATLFKKPVYSLVRGDTFKKKSFASLLSSLNMLPVYRISEGVENLDQNYETFEKCKEIFKRNGIVLIFSEGRCINEWKLRPLKKGTARLAISSWEEGIPLKVLPTGINYQSFSSFGKNIHLNFGSIIDQSCVTNNNGYGNTINKFNEKLRVELKSLVIESDAADKENLQNIFAIKQPLLKKILLLIPAFAGFILNAPLYIPLQKLSWRTSKHLDHYDSVLVGLLFILYPIYLLIIFLLVTALTNWFLGLAVFILLPFTAWSFIQLKKQF